MLFSGVNALPVSAGTYRSDIDGLRAVAVLLVLWFHAFPNTMPGGFIGVDLFFVISGYLISSIIIASVGENRFSYIDFYRRRIRRIFPALIVVMISCYVAGWFHLLADEFAQLGKHIAAGAGFVSNLVLWSEAGYFDNVAETKPLLHLWSLGVEEQFYIVWPILLGIAVRFKRGFVVAIALVFSFSLLFNFFLTPKDTVASFYSPVTRFWELLAGACLAYLHLQSSKMTLDDRIQPPPLTLEATASRKLDTILPHILSISGFVILALALVFITKGKLFPGYWAVLPVLAGVLIIAAGPQSILNRYVLSHPALVWVGLISYPLYLWHWPLLSFGVIIEGKTPSVEYRLTAVFASIALAWLTYKLIEKPLRFGARSNFKTVMLLSAMVVLGGGGILTWFKNGFPSRVDALATPSNEAVLTKYIQKLAAEPDYYGKLTDGRGEEVRAPYCHLNKEGQSFEDYAVSIDKCIQMSPDKKNFLVVGDSHAADLYAALVRAFPEYNFLQITGAGCQLDVVGEDNRCVKLVAFAKRFVSSNKLAGVFVGGRWQSFDVDRLEAAMKPFAEHTPNVYLVGPPQTYTSWVIKILARRRPLDTLQGLSQKYTDSTIIENNRALGDFARSHGIAFIDRIALFCGAGSSCPMLSPEGDLYSVDYGHLTPFGLERLGAALREYLPVDSEEVR